MQPALSDYRIDFESSDLLAEPGPEEYPLRIHGEIVYLGDRAKADLGLHETSVGCISAFQFHACETWDRRASASDMFKAVSPDAEECYAALFDGNELNQDMIDDQFEGDVFSCNVLFLAGIGILPAHRGRGLGLAVARRTILRFAPKAGLVAMLPFAAPSTQTKNSDREIEERLLDQNPNRNQGRLENYYRRLGFERIGSSRVFALNTARRLPPLRELCPELVNAS
ncbi:MAG: hypothetical protein QF744_04460 [SAR202 cluster bacterium]|nr:hypothetical protein [SAR202 cluster bacterium]